MTISDLRRELWEINNAVNRGEIGMADAHRRTVRAMLDYIDDPDVDEAYSRITSGGRDRVPLGRLVLDPAQWDA